MSVKLFEQRLILAGLGCLLGRVEDPGMKRQIERLIARIYEGLDEWMI